MSNKTGAYALVLCCLLHGCADKSKVISRDSVPDRLDATSKSNIRGHDEYAYISSAKGIFEYRINPNGSLKPLAGRPVKGSPMSARFCVDPQARRLYAIDNATRYAAYSTSDYVYLYAIGRRGQLLPQFAEPVRANLGVQVPVIDPQNQFLYLLGVDYATGENKLTVFDVQHSAQITRRQTIILPTGRDEATLWNMIPGQGGSSLFLMEWRNSRDGKRRWGELQEYHVDWRQTAPVSEMAHHQTDAPLLSGIRVGRRLVLGDWRNALYVCEIKDNRVNVLNTTPLSDTFTGDLPGGMAYRQAGSILYVGIQHGADSARVGPPQETVVAYHLSSDGQLHKLKTEANRYVGNPFLFVDNTGRFLYILGEGNTIDTYKIASDGSLSPALSRLKIDAPSGMVFIGGIGK